MFFVMLTIFLIVLFLIVANYYNLAISKKDVICPSCMEVFPINNSIDAYWSCPSCVSGVYNNHGDYMLWGINNKTHLFFIDPEFAGPILLSPPTYIDTDPRLGFNGKVMQVWSATRLMEKPHTITTELCVGTTTYFPTIAVVNGNVVFRVDNFDPDLLDQVRFKKMSFYGRK